MTKREIEKCENLMHEAIRYAKESKEELEKAMSEKDKTEREILHSKGFNIMVMHMELTRHLWNLDLNMRK